MSNEARALFCLVNFDWINWTISCHHYFCIQINAMIWMVQEQFDNMYLCVLRCKQTSIQSLHNYIHTYLLHSNQFLCIGPGAIGQHLCVHIGRCLDPIHRQWCSSSTFPRMFSQFPKTFFMYIHLPSLIQNQSKMRVKWMKNSKKCLIYQLSPYMNFLRCVALYWFSLDRSVALYWYRLPQKLCRLLLTLRNSGGVAFYWKYNATLKSGWHHKLSHCRLVAVSPFMQAHFERC